MTSSTDTLAASKPRPGTWLGIPGTLTVYARSKHALRVGNRVVVIVWHGGENDGRATVRHLNGDGRFAHTVYAEALIDPADVDAWVAGRFA